MSGPKSYSVEVFDKHLKTLFHLQSEIILLWEVAKSKIISDKSKGIEITSDEFIQKNLNTFNELSSPFFEKCDDDDDEVSQNQFDTFYSKVYAIVEQQENLKKTLQDYLAGFKELENDFAVFLDTEKFLTSHQTDLTFLKEQMISYVEESKLEEVLKSEKISQIKNAGLDFTLPHFNVENAKIFQLEQQVILDCFQKAKNAIGLIAESKSLNHSKNAEGDRVKLVNQQRKTLSPDKPGLVQIKMIENLLEEVSQKEHRLGFEERLQNLKRKTNDNAHYFSIELHEELKKHIRQQDFKNHLLKIDQELSSMTFISSLHGDVRKLKTQLSTILQQQVIKLHDKDAVMNHFKDVIKKNKQELQKKLVADRERLYIKSRLVAALRDLDYDVVGDTEVVDFESSDALLFQVPDRENFINLRFDASGQMLYNYLIVEDRNDLSQDETAKKLAGMEDTCTEFKNMLADLQKQGLNVALKNEIAITEKSLISLPAKYLETLERSPKQKSNTTKSRSQARKLRKN